MPSQHALAEYVSVLATKGLLNEPESAAIEKLSAAGLDLSTPIELVTYDSREVVANSLFIVKGAHFKPEYLRSAQDAGALLYVCTPDERVAPEQCELPALEVTDLRHAIVELGLLFNNYATTKIPTYGITGTKGKSTTTKMLTAVLNSWYTAEGQQRVGIMSSIDTYDGVIEEESHLTTPEPLELQTHFRHAVESKLPGMVLEISSQALKYGRVDGVHLNVGAILNIGEDHISPVEHPDFADYFRSKLRILQLSDVVCVNSGTEHFAQILAEARSTQCEVVTFGREESDFLRIGELEVDPSTGAITFNVHSQEHNGLQYSGKFTVSIPGVFNVENAAAAACMALLIGVPQEHVQRGLFEARADGRMEVSRSDDGNLVVIVDYAHNTMSFDALLNSTRLEYPGYAIITAFGSAGRKAISRRQQLGEAASRGADFIIITEDDPSDEPVAEIAAEIAQHVSKPYVVEEYRPDAAYRAIFGPYTDDFPMPKKRVVLLLGKGNESEIKRASGWEATPSDSVLAKQYLAQYNSTNTQYTTNNND